MASLNKLPGKRWTGLILGTLMVSMLAGCAAQTVVEPQNGSGPYNVAVKLDPVTLNPPQTGTISFSVTDAGTGKPVKDFEQVYGAVFHSILISRDLQSFRHSYAEQLTDNQASLFTYFEVFSNYYDYAIFKPAGAPEQVFRTNINIIGRPGTDAQLAEDPSLHKTAGWLTFDLLKGNGPIPAGKPTQIALYITERGRPVSALWPYLGAAGHLWLVDDKGNSFGHEVGASGAENFLPTAVVTPGATGTPGSTENSSAGSSSSGGTGGTGAAGAGAGGTRSGGVGTPEAPVTAAPSPTYASGVAQALSTAVALPTQQLASVQQTAQSSILGTPDILPSVGYGPTVAFTHTFPHAGLYKCWFEVYYRGQPVLVSYVLRVQ